MFELHTVPPEELSKLIPHVSAISYWLKDKGPLNSAEVLSDAPTPNVRKTVNECLNQYVSSLNAQDSDDLTNSQMRYILSTYDIETWAFAAKEIVCSADYPPLIDKAIKADLVDWAYYFIKDKGDNWTELFEEIGKSMSKLGHVSFNALGEFCSMIRDCTDPAQRDAIARKIGWEVLGTNETKGKTLNAKKNAAGELFCQMVNQASAIFGQAAAPLGITSYGLRSKVESTKWSLVHMLPPEKKAMQDLRTFYSYIDKKFVGIVEELFRYHNFEDIAEAINNRYGMIPIAWKSKLNKMKQEKKAGLEWFVYEQIRTPAPGAAKPPRARNMPPLLATNRTMNDKLVDSFIDSEVVFYRRIGGLGSVYVTRLNAIAQMRNEEARNLNLTQNEIDFLFAYRFQRVLDFTHNILTQLEVINLTRKHVKAGTTREGILAKVILEVVPQELFNSYLQYSISYPQCCDLIRQKMHMRNGSAHPGSDFIDIWNAIRNNIRTLEDKTLEEVMELPVKRVQNYKEILKQLLHNTDRSTSTYELLYNAYTGVKKAADTLTKASEHQAKRIFGP